MTIDEAIEGLNKIIDWPQSNLSPASVNSVRLGIEALKRVKEHRYYKITSSAILLPGETLE